MLISCEYKKRTINFTEDLTHKDNLFSVLIGVNGVGKSRLLSAIAINAAGIEKLPIATRNENISGVAKDLNPFYSKGFEGVITSSISPFDKFPVLKNNNNLRGFYKYLGVRGISSESIGFNHMARVVGDLIFQCQLDNNRISILDNVLNYLGYSEWIQFEFKIGSALLAAINAAEHELKAYREYITNIEKAEKNNKKSKRFYDEYYECFKPLGFHEDIVSSLEERKKIVEEYSASKGEHAEYSYSIYRFYKYKESLGIFTSLGFENINEALIAMSRIGSLNERINVTIDGDRNEVVFSAQGDEDYISEKFSALLEAGVFSLVKASIKKKNQRRPIGISSASSGEQSVLLSLLGIASYITDDFLILIDEPEICLHPSWQEKYIALLIKCFDNLKGCHFIIATHSPQIVANLSGDNCYVVNMTENETLSSSEFSKKSADFQLAKLFHAPGHRNEYLLKKITIILSEISSGNIDVDMSEVDEIIKLEKLLPDNDPVAKLITLLKKAIKIIN